jgi:diguanylate cyclase (GGDEF)-like protein
MPLDQEARRYADELFTDQIEERSRSYQRSVVAMTNQAAARGQIMSGGFYSELVRLGIENIRELGHARADTLITAYERAKLPLDVQAAEEIRGEATECCEVQGGYLAKDIQERATRAGMEKVGAVFAETIANEISAIQGQIRRKLSTKVYEATLDARTAAAENTQPEQLDDLLPIFPKRLFDPDLAESAAAADVTAPLSLLVIDFDHFKSVNDMFGHTVGNEVLIATASIIKSVCKGKGRCYRWGGDELAVLLPNHTSGEAQAVAERMRDAVAAIRVPNYPNTITLSIGVASYPGPCTSSDRLFNDADDAARAAKEAGRDRVSMAGGATETETVSTAVRLSSAEISRRVEKVRLWLRDFNVRSGSISCDVVNKSDEEVTVEEIRLESNGYAITEPASPQGDGAWKIGPRCARPTNFACQPDPAAALIRMNDNKGLFFKTELRVVLIYSALGQSREFSQTIPVQVKVAIKEITSLI